MGITIQTFSEMERFFLIELSYFDLKGMDLEHVSFQKTIPLSEMMAVLDQAENSAKRKTSGYHAYREKIVRRLRLIFAQSAILKKMKLVRYLNDNGNEYGTTENDWKSGLAAQAYSDEDGNVVLVFRGYEASSFAVSFHDFFSQAMLYLGIVSAQFQRGHHFFYEVAAVKGNLVLIGDGLGGSLALYTYVREKENFPNLSGIAINANKNILLWRKIKADKYLITEDFILKKV